MRIRIQPTLAVLLLLCWILAWFGTELHFNRHLNEMVVQEQLQAQKTADDVADSIRRNLHYVDGIPGTFQQALRVWKAVQLFGPSPQPSGLTRQQAFALWTANPVLSDLNKYLQVIRSSLGVDQIYVINAAGDAMQSDKDACRAAGMNEVLTKPLNREHLAIGLNQWTSAMAQQPAQSLREFI